jgi:YidC/Oxa1 family membrane protein insertase
MNKKIKDFLKSFLVWFSVFYLAIFLINTFRTNKEVSKEEGSVTISSLKKSFIIGNLPRFTIKNNSDQRIEFLSPCNNNSSLKVSRVANEQNFEISDFSECAEKTVSEFALEPGQENSFDIRDFSTELFNEEGKYEIEMDFINGINEIQVVKSQFTLKAPGFFRKFFRTIVTAPLFNLIVLLVKTLPGHSFGISVILLTVFVRLLLFAPNQKAMRSQRELQKLQPKIEELKRKHGKNQQLLAMKTMELYKTHKVNPMGSCLPMLLQMPILIGVYLLVRNGLSPHLNYLLYAPLRSFDIGSVNMDFLIWNLEQKPTLYILPVIVGITQFFAVKLSMISAKKKKENQNKPDTTKPINAAEQTQKMMIYILPVMIGFFTVSFPAGVGVYWFTSTLFGIVQQQIVNKQLDAPQVRRVS